MRRRNKPSYPADWLVACLTRVGVPPSIRDRLVPPFMRRSDAEHQGYANYGAYFDWILDAQTKASGFMEVKRQAYFKEPANIQALFNRHAVDLRQRSVLDVSGGPGTFAYFMRESVGSMTVSEYQPETVQAMRARIPGVRTFTADLNGPWTDTESFDVILYRSCIVFCNALAEHIAQIRHKVTAGGYVYVYSALPTLGNILRWQYEDYTVNVLYSEQTVRNILLKSGFEIVDSGITEEYRHYLRWYTRKEALFHLWGVWNLLSPRGPRGLDARAFWILARRGAA